uniref:Small capsid protein n=1 Tax=Cardioderma bat herpesvirus TaxID=3141914 RepID=A0AAU7E279_9VIRU
MSTPDQQPSSQGASNGASGSSSKKEEHQRRLAVLNEVLDLKATFLQNPTIQNMCNRYSKMNSGEFGKDAFKLDLLRMLAVARAPQ